MFGKSVLTSICIVLTICSTSHNTTNGTTTTSPTASPTISPTQTPTSSPTQSPTSSPTFAPVMAIFTTEIGPDIAPQQQLIVNFTLNFTSTNELSARDINNAVSLAYSQVQIPSNYISNRVQCSPEGEPYWFCDIFSSINAMDKSQAYSYQDQINTDPDHISSPFAQYLKQILNAAMFDLSIPKMDIIEVATESDKNGDTTQIIIWFLGVSAVCAIGALCLIICWRKFSSTDGESDNEGAINLEFLLDPNAQMDPNAPMHISDDNDLMQPIEEKKTKIRKTPHFSRLSDETPNKETLISTHNGNHSDEYEEYSHSPSAEEQDNNELMENYDPPNFSRI